MLHLRLLVITASLALAACGSGRDDETETENGGGTAITINDGDETSTMTFSGEDGEELTLNIGGDIEVEFPDGFTLYRGASVTNLARMSGSSDDGQMIGIESDASVASVLRHYRREAEAAGYDIKAEMNSEGMRMFNAEHEDGRTFSVQAMEEDEGSTAHLIFADNG